MTNLRPICIKLCPTLLAAIDERVTFHHGRSRTAFITLAIESHLKSLHLKSSTLLRIRTEKRAYTQRRHTRRPS